MSNKMLTFCHKYPKNLLTYLLEKYPDKPWLLGLYGISSNPNITLEWIEKYPDKPWYWGQCGISNNRSITLKWIEKYPDKPWYWGHNGISYNPNITSELIEKYINKIDFKALSENTFEYNSKKVKIISEKIKLFHYLSFSKIIYDIKRHIVTTF